MQFIVFIVFVIIVYSLLPVISFAQNKVVVIPLMKEALPLEPYAPLTAESPPASAYFDNIMGGHVTDKVTGLVWQKSDDDDTKTWGEAWEYCQNLTLPSGGWTDWRLPSIAELMSIVDYGAHNPAINPVFWGTNLTAYWSATTRANNSSAAWIISFQDGLIDYNYKSGSSYVRCVRRPSVRDNSFKNNANGTVSDLATDRMWQRKNDYNLRTWDEANSYCQGLSFGGKQDWRLPNVKELQSIVEDRVTDPAINPDVFPGTNWEFYWSTTTRADNSAFAWAVNFLRGEVANFDKSSMLYVRCVR